MEIRRVNEVEEKINISEKVLNQLPAWFGIPSSTAEYVRESSKMPFWAAYEKGNAVGFISVKENNEYTSELYVMGIEENYHHKGIGRQLFEECYAYCKEKGKEFIQVKTLDASNPDPSYAKTRKFYSALGFRPLECFTELWGEGNPCLIMIMAIK